MIRAIINADDFGLCAGVNEGILKAHREGILTSATIMANMPGFEQAAGMARSTPSLGVGVHLNLLRGRPVLPPDRVPSLLGPNGLLPGSVYVFLRRLAAGRIAAAEAEAELRAQVERVLAAGIVPDHLDSEKHLHTTPPVFRIAVKLAREYGIRGIRTVREFCVSPNLAQTGKSWAMSLSCALMRRRLRDGGIITPDRFYGVCRSGRMSAPRLAAILSRLGEGLAEIMLHPGYVTPELRALETITGSYWINNARDLELRALLDPAPRAVARERGIALITYRET